MTIEVLMLAIEGLRKEVIKLQNENKILKAEFTSLKEQFSSDVHSSSKEENKDEFLSTKQVQSMLGICYNTLQKVIKKGLITPIRINKRRVIFSKNKLLEYLYSKQNKSSLNTDQTSHKNDAV